MLSQLVHWADIAGTVLEAVVLVRMLTLKLHRLYVFVTLYWAVNLILDVARWAAGWESQGSIRIELYSWFLFAFILPLAAWDTFEELPQQLSAFRRTQAVRLVAGILGALLFAVIASIALPDDPQGDTDPAMVIGLFLMLGSTLASFLFVLTLYRQTRPHFATPRNTMAWVIYFLCSNAIVLLSFAFAAAKDAVGTAGMQSAELTLSVVDAVVTVWCITRLRRVPGETKPSENPGNTPC